MDPKSTLASMLGRFHRGAAAGTGFTETLEARGAERGDGIRPYLRAAALAAVALGGMALAATVAPASAQGTNGAEAVRLAAASTLSPPLLAMAPGAMERWAGNVPVRITDARAGSATFGGGTEEPAIRRAKVRDFESISTSVNWRPGPQVGLALSVDASASPEMICSIVVGGQLLSGSTLDKVAYLVRPNQRMSSDRFSHSINDWQFDNWGSSHEIGHCLDPATRAASVSHLRREATTTSETSYARYRMESRADAYATLVMAAVEGDARTAVQVAHLRMLGSVVKGADGSGLTTTSATTGDVVSSTGAEYLVTPAIDAAVATVRRIGIEGLRRMSAEELFVEADRAATSVELSPSAYARVAVALSDTRMEGERLSLSPELPASLRARFEAAAAATGFEARPGDFVDIAVFPRQNRAAAAPGPLAAPAMAAVRAALAEDLRQAKSVLSATRAADGTVTVRFTERLQAYHGPQSNRVLRDMETSAIVGRDGSVTRLDPNGRVSSLSPERPAYVRGGIATHVLPEGDLLVAIDATLARQTFDVRTYAMPDDVHENAGVIHGPGEHRRILHDALRSDMDAGAVPIRIDPRPGGRSWKVTLREADGTATSAVVRDDGAVARFGRDGREATIGADPMRPASSAADGSVRHVLVEGGHRRIADAETVQREWDARHGNPPGADTAMASSVTFR